MPDLKAAERARLPDSAFAYVDARGRRLLPIHDEAHVRNALARFARTNFEDDAARDRARRRLLRAARRYGIVPDGFIAGQLEPARRLPRGAITFLLSDMEGSTELLAELGEDYAGLLADLRRLLRRRMRQHGGREVDARADEFLAAFERPQAALHAALAIQLAIGEASWPAGVRPRLRMGIHSGRPTLTSEGYVGLAVHAVARVCSAAHGGQVIVSGATAAALAEQLPEGLSLSSLGEHRLRGLPNPIELLQLLAEGLGASFPPLRDSAASVGAPAVKER
ncbi:MAG TPA: adenylate/guanylate cyclase domain-containing protein [Candidatus Limnocylindria bacterium]|nr:adenylate/guanylate cyclase domain-containing protein [Candidatus Limnocylindria bacterium]